MNNVSGKNKDSSANKDSSENSDNLYQNNPLIHKSRRRLYTDSPWVRQFNCTEMKPLIICRGPIRKEAMDVFDEMGINSYGILLSEKDSIVYNQALAPELRQLTDTNRIHRVPDYSGADKEERTQRINQIIAIAHENGYNAIFAGYGFMAEDEQMVRAMEEAGLNFIGPNSGTQRAAGLKDEAKRTALECGVSVTPGVDNLTALTLLQKYKDLSGLKKLVADKGLEVSQSVLNSDAAISDIADDVLSASYSKGIDLISVDEMCAEAINQVVETFKKFPENRIRLKAIGGGGGKGQRILSPPSAFEGDLDTRIDEAAGETPELILEIINEVKTNGVGDNKNILIELNIETTRHQEIQVIGNGEWCTTLGARDCSLQMHEQKLLEVSQTQEDLKRAIQEARDTNKEEEAVALEEDLVILQKMEVESEKFGLAVGLDSVSTFECIVDKGIHFFMEMNTRIQVEHRVSELCYSLKFSNPDDESDFFIVDSLVEAMVLIASHGAGLPKPSRIPRESASVEARLNATNRALKPHAGGQVQYWSNPIEGEIRDDQGISLRNPDTDRFIHYTLAGAYDSNIALLLTTGGDRRESYKHMANVLRRTVLNGERLATNLEFHYGLVQWFLAENVRAKSTTQFIVPYLTMVGLLKQQANDLDINFAYDALKRHYQNKIIATFVGDDQASVALTAQNSAFDRKRTLVLRPIQMLLDEPHFYSGWLSFNKFNMRFDGDDVVWRINPYEVLDQTYHYLNMDYRDDLPAAYGVWKHDNEILQAALRFYKDIAERLNTSDYQELNKLLLAEDPQGSLDKETWEKVQSSHVGFQAGLEIFEMLLKIAKKQGFYGLKVNSDLTISIPEELQVKALQEAMSKVLVPPPATKADEIVAVCGGMFYAKEAPGLPSFVNEGDHFNEGDPLYIVEVMKMFNKVYAPFAGTIDKIVLENTEGEIVKEGQSLFKVTPDEKLVEEDPKEVQARILNNTKRAVEEVL